MSDRPQDPWAPDGEGASAPPPPPPPPVPIDEAAATDATEIRTGGIGARIVAAGVGAALLLGGVAFAATQVGGGSGAQTPEAAVEELFAAMGDEDVLGMLAALEPGERDTLSEPVQQLFEELERLEVVDESFELTGVPGVDLAFEDLTFRSEPIIDGLARVYLTGGTASYDVDGAQLPVGDLLSDTLERFGVDRASFVDSDRSDVRGDDGSSSDDFLVARETDDGWRVSFGYTAAEAARLASGTPMPATGMAAIGSDSPEEAVEGFLQAATRLDVRGLVGRLSPDEFRALHHYWPVLVDDSDLPTAEELGATVALTDLELDSTADGDRAQVFIRSIGADVTADDFAGGATVADGCVRLRGDALEAVQEELEIGDDRVCLDELDEVLDGALDDLGELGIRGIGDLVPSAEREVPEIGITTTKVDGRWYIAPIRTYADLGIAMLRTVEREDLEAAIDAVEEFFGGGFFGGGMVGGGFVPPGMGDEGWTEYETETSSEVGELIEPGTADARTSALVEELVAMVAGDTEVAACVLADLGATATPAEMVELADAYEYDLEPSPEVQDLLFGALERCGG